MFCMGYCTIIVIIFLVWHTFTDFLDTMHQPLVMISIGETPRSINLCNYWLQLERIPEIATVQCLT